MAKLTIERGTTYSRTVNYKLNGVATTLVSATIRFTMKATPFDTDTTDTSAAVKKNVTNGTAGGVAVITLAPNDTATLAPGKYYYDIKVDVNSDATTIYPLDNGTITLTGSPTNRLS